jgi:hypothetical protein
MGSDGTDDLLRIALPASLPCGLGECARPATTALLEPDYPAAPGLWALLPICDSCSDRLRADDPVETSSSQE